MTNKQIIETIKNSRQVYLNEVQIARKNLQKNLDGMTAQQIEQETIFITDMESRAYALMLLLEEIEEN